MRRRRTIAAGASLSGVGLHLGTPCRLAFAAAKPGDGIAFVRNDRPGAPRIPATADRAVLTERHTQLGDGENALHTVEHVLAAAVGLGFDDLTIELDGPEPPVLDGSARPFVEALQSCGVVLQEGTPRELVINEPLRVEDGDSVYVAEPAAGLELEVTIDFPHPLIGKQSAKWNVNADTFAKELAPARTFGFLREVDALRAKGLIQGASVENTIALDDAGVVSGTLRWPDEFVRHKALDVVGDLALAAGRIRGRISAYKPSHRGTITFVRSLLTRFAREDRVYGIEEIMKVLPHRYPFLLVDRILEIEDKKRIVGIKNVTINEPFFQGHFPGDPIMPGVLIIEAMAQVGGMLFVGSVEGAARKVVYFMSLDNVKFRRPVRPGDQLRFEIDLVQVRGNVCRIAGVAKVDGKVVAEAEMAAMVRDR
ncbi:MAG TPA: UDP-3-O-acyl-N-acetylglucosamine deacetylase [Gemmatimonadaceae bacterium]|nr:UDP-3-O-acyl-N-acetylglucosamine deacetylase [Gemmatimonadaceae bacterium]